MAAATLSGEDDGPVFDPSNWGPAGTDDASAAAPVWTSGNAYIPFAPHNSKLWTGSPLHDTPPPQRVRHANHRGDFVVGDDDDDDPCSGGAVAPKRVAEQFVRRHYEYGAGPAWDAHARATRPTAECSHCEYAIPYGRTRYVCPRRSCRSFAAQHRLCVRCYEWMLLREPLVPAAVTAAAAAAGPVVGDPELSQSVMETSVLRALEALCGFPAPICALVVDALCGVDADPTAGSAAERAADDVYYCSALCTQPAPCVSCTLVFAQRMRDEARRVVGQPAIPTPFDVGVDDESDDDVDAASKAVVSAAALASASSSAAVSNAGFTHLVFGIDAPGGGSRKRAHKPRGGLGGGAAHFEVTDVLPALPNSASWREMNAALALEADGITLAQPAVPLTVVRYASAPRGPPGRVPAPDIPLAAPAV